MHSVLRHSIQNGSRIWLYNYNFEFELAQITPENGDKKRFPWYFLNRSSSLFLPLAAADDRILVYEMPNPDLMSRLRQKLDFLPEYYVLNTRDRESNAILNDLFHAPSNIAAFESYRLEPWGWSPKAIKVANSIQGISEDNRSDIDIIRFLNSKRTSYILRNRLLPSSFRFPSEIIDLHAIKSVPLHQRIDKFANKHRKFYVKHYFGTSGQLSTFYPNDRVSKKALRQFMSWIEGSGGILLEKKLEARKEFSFQFDFNKSRATFVGMTEGLYSKFGSYRGSIVFRNVEHKYQKVIKLLEPVCDYILSSHYRGPLGIDMMETKEGGLKFLEINARYTMGRLAIAWHQKVNSQEYGLFSNQFFTTESFIDTRNLLNELDSIQKPPQTEIMLIHYCCRPYGKKFHCFCTILIGSANRSHLLKCSKDFNALFKNVF